MDKGCRGKNTNEMRVAHSEAAIVFVPERLNYLYSFEMLEEESVLILHDK